MRVGILILTVAMCVGCGGPSFAPVSGTVKLNGSPLPHATVVFTPNSDATNPGPGSIGVTNADGRYELRVGTTNAPGAIVGKHTVSISAYSGDGDAESSAPITGDKVLRKALLPAEYNARTKLAFDVPASGTGEADFPLAVPVK